MKAMLMGMRKFSSSKTNKDYTTVFLVYEDKDVIGQACGDALLNGHDYSEELVGQEVEVDVDLRGRVQGITPLMPLMPEMPVEPAKKAG